MTILFIGQTDNHVATADPEDGLRYGSWVGLDEPSGTYGSVMSLTTRFCPGRGYAEVLPGPSDDSWFSMSAYFYFRVNTKLNASVELVDARLIFNWFSRIFEQPANEGWEQEDIVLEVACLSAPVVTPTLGTKSALDAELASDITAWVPWTNDLVDVPGLGGVAILSDNLASILTTPLNDATWASGNYVKVFVRARFETDAMTFEQPNQRIACFHTWPYDEQLNDIVPGNYPHEDFSPRMQLTIAESLENTLLQDWSIEQMFSHTWKLSTTEQDFDITQEISFDYVHARTFEQVWDFEVTIAAARASDYDQDPEDTIYFEQVITPYRVMAKSLEQPWTIEQYITVESLFYKEMPQDYVIEQDIIAGRTREIIVRQLWTIDPLVQVAGPRFKDEDQTLFITQEFAIDPSSLIQAPEQIEQTLTFTQDAIIPGINRNITLEQDWTFTQVFLPILLNGTCKPESSWDPHFEVQPTEPTLVQTNSLILEFPTTSPTHTVTLPAPILTNREELDVTRLQRFSRGGDFYSDMDPTDPQVFTFRYKFENLTDQQKIDMFAIIGPSLGKKVKLTDHEGRVWTGLLINPNGEYINIFRTCGVTAEFDFRGVYV